ncbi:unnamed protein product, partial [Anisakis simplex]|uniref:Extensin-like n=1 Tax=Anisakis simplex TaxID=6269 RepID=A0A0M3JMT7_ANISI
MSPLAAHRARRMNTQPTISVVTPPIHVTAQPIQIPLRIAAPSFHVVPATPPQTSSSMQPEHHIQVTTTSSNSTHQHADHQTAPPASKPVFTSPTAATQPTAAFTATTTPTPTVYQHSPRQSRSSAHHFPHQQHQLQQQTQPMALKTSSQSTSSSIMSHFKNLVNV